MSVYHFKIYERSYVDVAVEANSVEEAKKGLGGWLEEDKDHDEFRDIMNSRCNDYTSYMDMCETSSPSDLEWDFYIKAEDYIKKEPLYTLVLAKRKPVDDTNAPYMFRQTYVDLTFDEVLRKLQEANKSRIINPAEPDEASKSTALSYKNMLLYYTFDWR